MAEIAVALKDVVKRPTDDDADISDLLANDPTPVEPRLNGTAGPDPLGTGNADPLWFLTKSVGPSNSPESKPVAAEEISLSRPEVLRKSLPPLFGVEHEPKSVHPASSSDDSDSGKKSGPPGQLAEPGPAATVRQTSGSDGAVFSAIRADTGLPRDDVVASNNVDAQRSPAVGGHITLPGEHDQGSTSAAISPPSSEKSKTDPGSALAPTERALEEMIAQLLEPVLRNWVEANLSGLVEKTVREEVARALRTEREQNELKI
jgi:hypothetical protein